MSVKRYLHATQEAGKALFQRGIQGPVVMLNMLRFRDEADYSASPELAPEQPISGREAYQRYMDAVQPLLDELGSEVLFFGKGGPMLIGPEPARWDAVLLVRHPGVMPFIQFAQNPAYQAVEGHRTAALEDSRLLPIEEEMG